MSIHRYSGSRQWYVIILLLLAACASPDKPRDTDIVETPEQFDKRVSENIHSALNFILHNKARLNDTIVLNKDSLTNSFYVSSNFKTLWSDHDAWKPLSDSLFTFIEHSKEYGLFPLDYHYKAIKGFRQRIDSDSMARKDAVLWSRADLLLTDAFLQLCQHLKQGRLPYDSVTLRKDTVLTDSFYRAVYDQVKQTGQVTNVLRNLEPVNSDYVSLKESLKNFLDSVKTFRRYTYVKYPEKDSTVLYGALQRRFFEDDYVLSPSDSLSGEDWKNVISKYQKDNGLKETGKINSTTVKNLNNTSWEKFKTIAVTLDRYKQLPDSMPTTYIWVNIPSYSLKVVDSGNVAMTSRVIVGQPRTRTPLLTSRVSDFITYPQWTVPYSIIFKEMLPQIRRNTAYLAKQNLIVVDKNDSIIHPDSINWFKLSKKYFPYLIKQRQGDDNSLGVLKFNFPNKYSVYLHDTNARWMFSRSERALSHGCVRVKDFMKLANFLVRNDTAKYHPDTLNHWIARQEKHIVSGFQRIPVFIRYFPSEGVNGKLKFYEDIYGEDKVLKERYFADKPIQ